MCMCVYLDKQFHYIVYRDACNRKDLVYSTVADGLSLLVYLSELLFPGLTQQVKLEADKLNNSSTDKAERM